MRGKVHTNEVEGFWSTLQRAYKGTFHKMSAKHLQRYVNEMIGRHNLRGLDTIVQVESIARGLVGKRLRFKEPTASEAT